MSFNFNPYNRVKTEGSGSGGAVRDFEERKKARPDTGQDAFFVSRIGGSGGVAIGVVGFPPLPSPAYLGPVR